MENKFYFAEDDMEYKMKLEMIASLYNCLNQSDYDGLKTQLQNVLDNYFGADRSKSYAYYLRTQYVPLAPSYLDEEKLRDELVANMSINPDIAISKFPHNPIFKMILEEGLFRLFDSYLDAGLCPYFRSLSKEEAEEKYSQLLDVIVDTNSSFLDDLYLSSTIIGQNEKHLEDPTGTLEHNENKGMKEIMDNYDKILGRQLILNAFKEELEVYS